DLLEPCRRLASAPRRVQQPAEPLLPETFVGADVTGGDEYDGRHLQARQDRLGMAQVVEPAIVESDQAGRLPRRLASLRCGDEFVLCQHPEVPAQEPQLPLENTRAHYDAVGRERGSLFLGRQ